MFEITLERSFDFLSEEYRQLFNGSRATAFQHPLWLDRLYRRLAPQVNAEPIVIAIRWRDSGRLAMLLPLMRRRRGALRVIEFADLGVSDYASPVCDDSAFAQIACDRQACERIRAQLKPYDLLRIKKIPDKAPPLEQLFGVSDRSPLDISAHAVRLYEPFSQWRSDNISFSYRKNLERKRRALKRKGAVHFEHSRDPALIKSTFYSMREHRRKRFAGDLLQKPVFFDFYMDIALHGSESGYSRTYTLSLDGQPIGGAWGLTHQRQFLFLMAGMDFVTYMRQSIGALSFEDIARDCIEQQDLVLDFTLGDESYKRLFGAQPSKLWMCSAGVTPPGMVANFVAGRAPWAMKVAKEVLNRSRGSAAAHT